MAKKWNELEKIPGFLSSAWDFAGSFFKGIVVNICDSFWETDAVLNQNVQKPCMIDIDKIKSASSEHLSASLIHFGYYARAWMGHIWDDSQILAITGPVEMPQEIRTVFFTCAPRFNIFWIADDRSKWHISSLEENYIFSHVITHVKASRSFLHFKFA